MKPRKSLEIKIDKWKKDLEKEKLPKDDKPSKKTKSKNGKSPKKKKSPGENNRKRTDPCKNFAKTVLGKLLCNDLEKRFPKNKRVLYDRVFYKTINECLNNTYRENIDNANFSFDEFLESFANIVKNLDFTCITENNKISEPLKMLYRVQYLAFSIACQSVLDEIKSKKYEVMIASNKEALDLKSKNDEDIRDEEDEESLYKSGIGVIWIELKIKDSSVKKENIMELEIPQAQSFKANNMNFHQPGNGSNLGEEAGSCSEVEHDSQIFCSQSNLVIFFLNKTSYIFALKDINHFDQGLNYAGPQHPTRLT